MKIWDSVYIFQSSSHILHITNHAGPSVLAAICVLHLWILPLLRYGHSSWCNYSGSIVTATIPYTHAPSGDRSTQIGYIGFQLNAKPPLYLQATTAGYEHIFNFFYLANLQKAFFGQPPEKMSKWVDAAVTFVNAHLLLHANNTLAIIGTGRDQVTLDEKLHPQSE